MGVLIKINDANFNQYVALAEYPVISSLKNLYFMGGTEAKSTKDESGNGNNGTIAGTVTYGDHYAAFTGTGSTNKMAAQTLSGTITGITVIALFKKSGLRAVVSTAGGGVTNGAIQVAPGRLVYCSDTDETLRDIRFNWDDSNNYYIGAWQFTPTEYNVLIDRNNVGLSTVANGTGTGNSIKLYAGTNASLGKLNIGGSTYNFGMDGDLNLAVCAFYDSALTISQIEDAAIYLRGYGEKQGFTIN